MPTPRKRSSGFSTSAEKPQEEVSIEEFLEESAKEMLETISREEEEAEVKLEVVEPKPFIPMEIAPTEDVGPRFIEETPAPAAQPVKVPPQLQPPPKRHPRNVPKFSRYK